MVKVEEFNGKPVLVLNPEDKYPFKFGKSKAKLILDNMNEIRRFYDDRLEEKDLE